MFFLCFFFVIKLIDYLRFVRSYFLLSLLRLLLLFINSLFIYFFFLFSSIFSVISRSFIYFSISYLSDNSSIHPSFQNISIYLYILLSLYSEDTIDVLLSYTYPFYIAYVSLSFEYEYIVALYLMSIKL